MRNRRRLAAAVFAAALSLSGMTAFAQTAASSSAPAPTATPKPTATAAPKTEKVIEDSRSLTPAGNATLLDNESENENLQFITVTARDGAVFYFVIDHGAGSDNVYFLNTVDESDLAALIEDGEGIAENPAPTPTPAPQEPESESESEPEQAPEQSQPQSNNAMVLGVLALAALGGLAVYYFKVMLPKKKLSQADDIEDFEFEDGPDEDNGEPENEDEPEESDDMDEQDETEDE